MIVEGFEFAVLLGEGREYSLYLVSLPNGEMLRACARARNLGMPLLLSQVTAGVERLAIATTSLQV